MIFTRENLHNIFLKNEELNKKLKIKNVIEFITDKVIKNAKIGKTTYNDSFTTSLDDIIFEISTELKNIFPDCVVEIYKDNIDFNNYNKGLNISINWT